MLRIFGLPADKRTPNTVQKQQQQQHQQQQLLSSTLRSSLKWWPWWLLLPGCLASWTRYVEEYDSMRVARCDALCGENFPEQCMESCLRSNYTKPGNCPERAAMSSFESACLNACNADSNCPELAKCCGHECGVTCMHPTGLEDRRDLPMIPENLKIWQHKGNLVQLSWRIAPLLNTRKYMNQSYDSNGDNNNSNNNYNNNKDDNNNNSNKKISTNKNNNNNNNNNDDDDDEDDDNSDIDSEENDKTLPVRYLIEERHLLGPRYLESRLSSWTVRHVSTKPHATLRGGLKSGHWYQFRVAAINQYGTKGYSQPSSPFMTRKPRNPREPQNVTLFGARLYGKRLRIHLHWTKPSSDVPILFYKVFWSRRIHGPTNDSVLVYHRPIPKDRTCYELKDLELGCQYFLQVQAIAVYGNRRLSSPKASKVFNTTDYMKFADTIGGANTNRSRRRCDRLQHQEGLHIRRITCDCDGEMRAKIRWPVNRETTRYNVTWKLESCAESSRLRSDEMHRKSSLSRITEKPRFEIDHLLPGCTYNVNVRGVFPGKFEDRGSSIEVLVDGCRRKNNNSKNHRPHSRISAKCKQQQQQRYRSSVSSSRDRRRANAGP